MVSQAAAGPGRRCCTVPLTRPSAGSVRSGIGDPAGLGARHEDLLAAVGLGLPAGHEAPPVLLDGDDGRGRRPADVPHASPDPGVVPSTLA